ncbi:testicular haploid expressed gene protein-like [Salarias fasciatus]|uniref:testicular haploid expressed gene protein-like n=1 Tax=Salarias fasciatus TaxID=181472 RepID=UPI00117693E8|nr:testicular haploid expressed gene protein-like [Salarias fasciatus]
MAARIHQLAQPRADQLRSPDRRSVYWLDKLPPERTGSTTNKLTPRLLDLCKSKRFDSQDTISPIWAVSKCALKAVASQRLCRLAEPRRPVTGWQLARQLPVPLVCGFFCQLSSGTQTVVATPRIFRLAQPKIRRVQDGSGQKCKAGLLTHLPSKANAHIELLATPKHDHPMFKGERSACWPVSRTARHHAASQRLHDLAAPRERKALFEGYDPYAVSRAARSAQPSPRIQQLCLPLPRKCISQ